MRTGEFQRNTRQRQVILEELCRLKSHPTAAELHRIVRKQLPKISLGTIYRNLDILVRNDMIQKLDFGGSEARFDGNPNRHYHLRCIQCGRVDDIKDLSTGIMLDDFKRLKGYKIHHLRIEFLGICPECQKKAKTDNKDVRRKKKNRR